MKKQDSRLVQNLCHMYLCTLYDLSIKFLRIHIRVSGISLTAVLFFRPVESNRLHI